MGETENRGHSWVLHRSIAAEDVQRVQWVNEASVRHSRVFLFHERVSRAELAREPDYQENLNDLSIFVTRDHVPQTLGTRVPVHQRAFFPL